MSGVCTLKRENKWVIGIARFRLVPARKVAVVTVVERKTGDTVMAKVSNKTWELVASAIVGKLQPLAVMVKFDI